MNSGDQSRLHIGDLLVIAEDVLGVEAARLLREVNVGLAESALAAPFATFGGEDFYPDPIQRAAIACSRLVRNHPFTDGNKRVGYAAMRLMIDEAGWEFDSTDQRHTAEVIEALAAREVSEQDFVQWVAVRCERKRSDE